MANTENDLINLVLENLRVKPATQAPSAEDAEVVRKRIQPTLDLLNGKNVAVFGAVGDLSDIPDQVLLPLAACVAYQCATLFMVSPAFKKELQAERDEAIRDLTLMNRQGFAGKELSIEHFWDSFPVWRR